MSGGRPGTAERTLERERRRPYRRPELRQLGSLADVTRGQNGSNWDPGHSNYTKKGGG